MNKILKFIFSCLVVVDFAFAQNNTTQNNLIVKQPSVAMARAPRGGKMGEIYINSPVTVEKEDGEWVLVSLKTWVKKDGLGAPAPAANAGKQAVSTPSKDLVIESFSTRIVQDGLPEKRVYLTLKLKNNTQNQISSWKALLVAQANEAVAFREAISDDTKLIPSGQVAELNFYWEPSEQPFQYLKDATPESLKLDLYQVVIEQN